MVRGFARWLKGYDERTEVPPAGLIPAKWQRPRPYIYSDKEVATVVARAAKLRSQYGLRGWTFSTLFGLIAVTGLRINEALKLDDDDVDLDYHVRRIILSKPGTFQQLEQYVARLHSSLMDRSRPLWELYVIEGLQSGQMAVYSKVHHAAVDGQAGVALAKALYDVSPEPRQIKPRREKRRSDQYQLGAAELVVAAMKNTAEQYMKMITTLPNTWQALTSISLPKISGALPNIGPNTDWGIAPRTPLNVSITNQRTYAARSVSLADVKQTAKRLNVTLNDVVLAACAQALRRYLADDNALPKAPLLAAVPVSLRAAGNTEQNNQATIMLALISDHGRSTPLVWLTVDKRTLKDHRTLYEHRVLVRLAELVPAGIKVCIVADRGFGDQKLYKMLTEELYFDYVIRFRGNIAVTAACGETRSAAAWVRAGGRARPGERRARDTAVRHERGLDEGPDHPALPGHSHRPGAADRSQDAAIRGDRGDRREPGEHRCRVLVRRGQARPRLHGASAARRADAGVG